MAVKPKLCMIPSGYKGQTATPPKLYSVLPSDGVGDFDFTRASEATRVNQNGLIETVGSNVPRIDYTDGGCPKLLLEPQRTNSLIYSEQFDNGAWGKDGSVTITPNFSISPDGTQNAERFQKTATAGNEGLTQNIFGLSAGTYTLTFYIKSNTNSNQNARLLYGGFQTSSIVITPNWERFEITYTANTSVDYNGILSNEALDISIYGAQLEEGSYPTSYIPTNGATATRSAETCNNSGDANTFNDSEGVLFAEISALANDGTIREIALSNGGAANRIEIRYSGSNIQGIVRFGASVIVLTYNLADTTEFTKVALKYKSGDYSFWVNGLELQVDTTTGTPTGLSEFAFDDGNGNDDFYGNIKQLQYFDTALNDTDLEELTSWQSFNEMAMAQQYTIQ